MRKSLVVIAGAVLLAAPLVGNVQQAPAEVNRAPASLAELQNLMSAQTEAIKALHKRVIELETRVKKLEDVERSSDGR